MTNLEQCYPALAKRAALSAMTNVLGRLSPKILPFIKRHWLLPAIMGATGGVEKYLTSPTDSTTGRLLDSIIGAGKGALSGGVLSGTFELPGLGWRQGKGLISRFTAKRIPQYLGAIGGGGIGVGGGLGLLGLSSKLEGSLQKPTYSSSQTPPQPQLSPSATVPQNLISQLIGPENALKQTHEAVFDLMPAEANKALHGIDQTLQTLSAQPWTTKLFTNDIHSLLTDAKEQISQGLETGKSAINVSLKVSPSAKQFIRQYLPQLTGATVIGAGVASGLQDARQTVTTALQQYQETGQAPDPAVFKPAVQQLVDRVVTSETKKYTDAGLAPEEAATRVSSEISGFMQGKMTPESVQKFYNQYRHAIGAPNSPWSVAGFTDFIQNAPTWQRVAVLVGIPLALAGILNMLFGSGGLKSMLATGLGAASAAYGSGMLGGTEYGDRAASSIRNLFTKRPQTGTITPTFNLRDVFKNRPSGQPTTSEILGLLS